MPFLKNSPPDSIPEYITDNYQEDDDDVEPLDCNLNRPLLRSSKDSLDNVAKTPDKFYLALIIFYLLGMGSLMPWNFFTTAREYFMYKLRNTSLDSEGGNSTTYLQDTFESYLSVFANVPNLIFMFLNMALTRCVRTSYRLLFGLIIMIIVFIITVVMSCVDTDSAQNQFFWITMSSIVVMNSGAAIMQGSLFGLASLFPHKYTKALMQGQSVGGVVAALAYIASLGSGSSAKSSGTAFFSSATAALFLCLVSYLVLCRLPFAQETMRRAQPRPILTESQNRTHMIYSRLSVHWWRPKKRFRCYNSTGSVSSTSTSINSEQMHVEISAGTVAQGLCPALLGPAACVFLVFTVTLSLYPSLLSSILSVNDVNGAHSLYFSPLACFLVFNLSDLIGRSIPAVCRFPKSSALLVLFAVLRVVFVPLFLFCNYHPRNSNMFPFLFNSDVALPIINTFFGITNGYLSTLAMMTAPTLVPPEFAETSGALMSFFLTLGLGVGSATSFVFTLVL